MTCTSGTAAANFAPAVIEARWARVPLIVMTADRPPELREVGAGQAIDQLKLYGDAVKWFFEVGVTRRDARPAAVDPHARLPGLLDGTGGATRARAPQLPAARAAGARRAPPRRGHRTRPADSHTSSSSLRIYRKAAQGPGPHPSGRLVIVAGEGTPDPVGLASFAARAGIPLLADPLSDARRGAAAVAHYDLLLREPRFTRSSGPQFVFRLGELPTSKPLRAWLAGLNAAQIAFDPDHTWHDPDSVVGMRLRSALPRPDELSVEPGWLDAWRDADREAGRGDRCRPRRRALGAGCRPAAAGLARSGRHARGGLLDADSGRGVVPRCGRGCAAHPLQPRSQRDRRDRFDGVRRGRGLRRSGCAADRRRRARARPWRHARRAASRAGADDRAAEQRRRRDLPLPPGRLGARRLRGARGDTPRA